MVFPTPPFIFITVITLPIFSQFLRLNTSIPNSKAKLGELVLSKQADSCATFTEPANLHQSKRFCRGAVPHLLVALSIFPNRNEDQVGGLGLSSLQFHPGILAFSGNLSPLCFCSHTSQGERSAALLLVMSFSLWGSIVAHEFTKLKVPVSAVLMAH